MSLRAVAFASLVLLSGCATAPSRLETRAPQQLTPGAFRLATAGPEPSSSEQLLIAGLEARGFRRVESGQPAHYLATITLADRPRTTEARLPREPGQPALLQPRPRRSLQGLFQPNAYDVRVEIIDSATGLAVYEARLSRIYRKPRSEDLALLVTAALQPLRLR